MDGADPRRWSLVAADWAELWGGLAAPLWQLINHAAAVGPGRHVLDVGCGSGDLLAHMHALGARTAGLDPATSMVDVARDRVPCADVRRGSADQLPWSDDTFHLTTAVNALQFADSPLTALRELSRVTRPEGLLAVSNWADADRNDVDTIDRAVARAAGRAPLPGGDLRTAHGLATLFTAG